MPNARKPSNLKPLKTLNIFCEGEKTEPNYLKGYIATLDHESRRSVVEIQKTRKNTAVELVDVAIKAKRSAHALPEDEFWVVYDRESVAKYTDNLHAKAYDKAEGAGIRVALCNVCFEYWLLLHFVDTEAPYHNYDELRKNSALNDEVKKLCGGDYDKASTSIFAEIKNLIPNARQRGKRLNERGKASAQAGKDKPFQINPYVGIVDLLQAIDDFT